MGVGRRAVALADEPETRVAAARAAWRFATAAPSARRGRATSDGLGDVERALVVNPRLAEAHAIRGALLMLRSRGEASASSKSTIGAAREALERAFAINPLLRREFGELATVAAKGTAAGGR